MSVRVLRLAIISPGEILSLTMIYIIIDCDSCLHLTGWDSLEELSQNLGDGVCNPDLNIMQCDWDWGDCNDLTCDIDFPERIGGRYNLFDF